MERRKNRIADKLSGRAGKISRLTLLLIIVCVIAAIAIIIFPTVRDKLREMRRNECKLSLTSAQRRISIDANLDGTKSTAEQIKEYVTKAMFGWDDLCPDGGTVYVVPSSNGDMSYTLVCGLHGEDKKLNTRLNAGNCLDQIREAVSSAKASGGSVPTEIEVEFNSQKYKALITYEDPKIRRGTYSYTEYDGVVIYYAVAGMGDFASGFHQNDGEVSYFVFADENYCAIWSYTQSWTGDSYK